MSTPSNSLHSHSKMTISAPTLLSFTHTSPHGVMVSVFPRRCPSRWSLSESLSPDAFDRRQRGNEGKKRKGDSPVRSKSREERRTAKEINGQRGREKRQNSNRTRKENRKCIRKSLSLHSSHCTLHTHSVSMKGKRESCIERPCQSLEICSLERRTVSVYDITTHMESKEVSFYLCPFEGFFLFTFFLFYFTTLIPNDPTSFLFSSPCHHESQTREEKRYLQSSTESYCFIRHRQTAIHANQV